jgi:acyl carrier protein
MTSNDPLRQLLIDFFELPPETPVSALSQAAIPKWDSLAMVQIITELQSSFSVEFGFEEIDQLTDYGRIRAALKRKGCQLPNDSGGDAVRPGPTSSS